VNTENIKLKDCLELFPLRIAVTDHCNLRCFFCSNEGMPILQKNKTHIDTKQLKYFIKVLINKGLKNISITGGEPTMHPKIIEIINFLNQFNLKNLFFHTNGINLNEELLKKLSIKFNKIAISIHSVNFYTWQRITNGTEQQFKEIIYNLGILPKFASNTLVELKYVPIRGYNDSPKEFKDFVEFCNSFGFKFKFLNFEPISPTQIKLAIPLEEIKRCLINIGCQTEKNERSFRGQSNYLPIKKIRYKNISGVIIEIGCGNPKICKECYQSNEIFITPDLKIKPCHINSYQINLKNFIEQKNSPAIFKAIVDSRLFLTQSPGAGFKTW